MRVRRGQALYRVPAKTEPLIDYLVARDLLRDGAIHSHAEIEAALAIVIDDLTTPK
jgi:hypothetical protein